MCRTILLGSLATAAILITPSAKAAVSYQLSYFDVDPGETFASGINNVGTIVGTTGTGSSAQIFVRQSNGVTTTFSVPGGVTPNGVYGINDGGTIAGDAYTSSGGQQGFIRSSNGAMSEFSISGTDRTYAYGINNSGTVLGYALSDGLDGNTKFGVAYTRQSDGSVDTFTFPGNQFRQSPTAINNLGAVVDHSTDLQKSYVREPDGEIITIGGLEGFGTAYGINDLGTVVGNVESSVFILAANGTVDFLEDPVGETLYARAINDEGVIVGYTEAGQGFIASPVPLPSSFALFGTVLTGAYYILRKRRDPLCDHPAEGREIL